MDKIDEQFRNKIYKQDYSKKQIIEGVKLVDIRNNIGEEGDFSEIIRLNNGVLTAFPQFHLAQINRTKVFGKSVKAWHLHLKQDEIWYLLPQHQILIGLWDLRKNSLTKGLTMRTVLGGGRSQLLFIPKGIAHGSLNLQQEASDLFYFVDQQFDLQNPDEYRLSWDSLGKDFWQPTKD